MKKLLILGCSFSAGSYGRNLAWVEGRKKPDPEFRFLLRNTDLQKTTRESSKQIYEDIMKESLGWYHFVDIIKEYETTVLSFPGNGYSMWAQILNIMEKMEKLDQYDSIFIQESWEPRTCFCDPLLLAQYIKIDWNIISENINNITRSIPIINHVENELRHGPRHINGFLMEQDSIDKLKMKNSLKKEFNKYLLSPLHDLIIEASARYIDNICKKYNINGYIFNIWKSYYNFTHIKRIKFNIKQDTLYSHLYEKKLLTYPDCWHVHQTLDGNKEIGRLLNEQIK